MAITQNDGWKLTSRIIGSRDCIWTFRGPQQAKLIFDFDTRQYRAEPKRIEVKTLRAMISPEEHAAALAGAIDPPVGRCSTKLYFNVRTYGDAEE